MKDKIAALLIGVAIGLFVVAAIDKRPNLPQVHSFASAAKIALPSVVEVAALVPDDEQPTEGEGFYHDILELFHGVLRKPYRVDSYGSGVIIDKRGHILTNQHVIKQAEIVTVKLYGIEREVEAEVIGVDPLTDLALIKIKYVRGLVPAKFADSSFISAGQRVAAIGNPFNLHGSFTVGVISALNRSGLGVVDLEDFIQTDARIFPGNSGGPLLNIKGEVVGINTAVIKEATGIGFAIPSSSAFKVAMTLLKEGSATRGDLGITTVILTKNMALLLGLPEETKGLLVTEIEKGSSAWRGGLRAGDVIISFDGLLIETPRALNRLAMSARKGDEKEVSFLHKGEPYNTIVALDAK
ncbi:HtrA protease/chaperone protein [hydrothermal vent metagenome]|uniref:HtrA protease/chaperone protein n=1 Tax=hydrothermal vent metagenome TaxID=652676 RepID=A0A3B1BXE5_9ZZZZ